MHDMENLMNGGCELAGSNLGTKKTADINTADTLKYAVISDSHVPTWEAGIPKMWA